MTIGNWGILFIESFYSVLRDFKQTAAYLIEYVQVEFASSHDYSNKLQLQLDTAQYKDSFPQWDKDQNQQF